MEVHSDTVRVDEQPPRSHRQLPYKLFSYPPRAGTDSSHHFRQDTEERSLSTDNTERHHRSEIAANLKPGNPNLHSFAKMTSTKRKSERGKNQISSFKPYKPAPNHLKALNNLAKRLDKAEMSSDQTSLKLGLHRKQNPKPIPEAYQTGEGQTSGEAKGKLRYR
ncbi:hypothetical protein F2Q70_00031920 [Brassica cretica]|uniref:Uncharacterized protein n=1 Tax=Brassica cretica TaxID=69181 RepID=A0A8S9FFJ2_BRACR|nr:hypothetical protein F2Q70_00031920 [Brassica cretica]